MPSSAAGDEGSTRRPAWRPADPPALLFFLLLDDECRVWAETVWWSCGVSSFISGVSSCGVAWGRGKRGREAKSEERRREEAQHYWPLLLATATLPGAFWPFCSLQTPDSRKGTRKRHQKFVQNLGVLYAVLYGHHLGCSSGPGCIPGPQLSGEPRASRV